MQSSKRKKIGPILSIRSDTCNGLQLSWNFTDIQFPSVQYYHIFLFLTDELEDSRAFYWNYWHHLKPGQIFGIFSCNKGYYQPKTKISWEQKSTSDCYPHNVKNSHLSKDIDQNLLQQITELIQKRRGIVVLNIFFGFQKIALSKQKLAKTRNLLQNYVNRIRINCRTLDRVLYNLVSKHFQHSQFNSNNGFNFISFQAVNAHYTCLQLLAYVRAIIFRSLILTLETQQKLNILTCNSRQWIISDGSQMTKRYCFIPKISFNEYIQFFQIKNEPRSSFQIQISLKFTFLDQSQIRDKKRIIINPINNINFLHTIIDNADLNKFGKYELTKSIFVNTNLLKQESNILFSRILQKQSAKLKNAR